MKKMTVLWLALLLVTVVALIPAMPTVSLPKEDSGIFLYFGRQLLNGQVLYTDLFDHKPPMVFYLNALGIALGGTWGVWGLQLLSVGAAGVFGFLYLRRYFGSLAAGFAAVSFLLNLVLVLERGNLTEEYALPLQFGALALFAGWEDGRARKWRSFLMGICAGAAFMLRQNLIGLWLALGVLVVLRAAYRRRWQDLLQLAMWGGGALLVIGLWVLVFAAQGNLSQFWDAAFVYNFVYSTVSNVERLAAVQFSLDFLTQTSAFFIIASLAWLASVSAILIYHAPVRQVITARWMGVPLVLLGAWVALRAWMAVEGGISAWRGMQMLLGLSLAALGAVLLLGWFERKVRPWLASLRNGATMPIEPLAVVAVGFPIEVGLLTISATNFAHYYLSIMPVLTVLVAFVVYSMRAQPGARKGLWAVWLVLFFVVVNLGGIRALSEQSQPHVDEQLWQTSRYIQEQTRAEEKILVWGFNTGVYYLSERQAASRMMMQGPLFREGYTSPQKVRAFLDELKSKPPTLIIDTRLYPFVEGGSPATCVGNPTGLPAGMGDVFSWVCERYELAGSFGRDHWLIYRVRK